ncbi:SOS response-associated peptidase family protein [Amycolatopsis thailandensis]|uniref:SOS response-associated peptidase family protein n=1 Tax=Amycolatopsis thailandensis TaxID=589330 RepID=UPI00363E3E66
MRTLMWGLVPSWAKEVKLGRLINARSEAITEKPAFYAAAANAPQPTTATIVTLTPRATAQP